jgi:hypothetical protein
MNLQSLHERLMTWATAEPRKERLLEARRIHFEAYGEPHEEDRSYEARLNGMLDFFLYDYRPAPGRPTTIEEFLASEAAALDAEERGACGALARTVHSLFEVRKLQDGRVRLRDAFTRKDHDVSERRQLVGLAKGDVLEARLLPYDGGLVFSGAFLYHPREARKPILAEVKRRKKAAGKGGTPDVRGLLALLSRMAFKLERYRNVRLESIYDFSPESLRQTAPRGVPP